ncbi:uncharacterized protein LOC143029247 [Oratosquilla oratoria]|uniref:uncharacterized protein LOC143029247 n=1 Tax=Oratosquilla oratoria TaxID=337810 RepID=UPI003F76AA02
MYTCIISLTLTLFAASPVISTSRQNQWSHPSSHFGKTTPTPNLFGLRSDPTEAPQSGTDYLVELLNRPETKETVDKVMPAVVSFISFVRSLQAIDFGGDLTNTVLAPKVPVRIPAIPIYVPEINLGNGNKIEAVDYTIPEVSYDVPEVKIVPA